LVTADDEDYVSLAPPKLVRQNAAESRAGYLDLKEVKESKQDEKKVTDVERSRIALREELIRRVARARSSMGRRSRRRGGRRSRSYGDQNANMVYRMTVSDAVGITANGSGNTIGSLGLDPSNWTSFSVYQDMFAKYRVVKAEYRIVTAGANVSTTPQSLVIAFDAGATSLTPGSQAVLWQFPRSKIFQLASASGVAADKRQFDFVTNVVPDQEWYDMITPSVQRGAFAYYGDGATASVAAWTLYVKYHVEFSGLVTP
jgi:hypothetical protein